MDLEVEGMLYPGKTDFKNKCVFAYHFKNCNNDHHILS